MAPRSLRPRLQDILDNIAIVSSAVAGRDFASIAIGNKLRHEYQRIDPDIIWEIADTHLNELRPVIEAILADHS